MVIRFLQSWQTYAPGREYEFTDGVATTLIRRRIAEAALPTIGAPPVVAAQAVAKRKPGRPRKS